MARTPLPGRGRARPAESRADPARVPTSVILAGCGHHSLAAQMPYDIRGRDQLLGLAAGFERLADQVQTWEKAGYTRAPD